MAEELELPDALPRVVGLLAAYLEKATEENDKRRPVKRLRQQGSAFDMIVRPVRAARGLLDRLPDLLPDCSPRCYVLAFAYLDRLLWRRRHSITLDSFNVRRLLLTALLLATKFEHRSLYDNSKFASIAHVKLMVMNKLEWEFFKDVDYQLGVKDGDFDSYCKILLHQDAEASNSEIARPIPPASTLSTLSLPCSLYAAEAACDGSK
ncbi:Cyclin-P4-1 [Ananas comosus]|uniref:Cyclin-P4-1 n=1 Tax=Ananas comosus TaxID=4615 RepID=A0A199VMQ8_ANACO|nr:Cyclin-P4-1 [Ananas comosus]